MADPYLPPNPLSGRPTATTTGLPPRTEGNDYSRTNVRIDSPPPVPVDSGNGFGTGLIVALVFLVVAVLAYALFNSNDEAGPVPAATPDVAIENNAVADPAPDAVAPDTVNPDAVAPDTVNPDTVAPDAVAPEAGSADPVAPAPGEPAPDAAPAAPANP